MLVLPGIPLDPEVSRLWLALACAGAAVVGHCYPIWFDLKGGKGAATAVGALLGLAPGLIWPALLVWCLILTTTGFVGLATVLAAVALPIWVAMTAWPEREELCWFLVALAVFVIYTHRSNIQRLRQGRENRLDKALLWRRQPNPPLYSGGAGRWTVALGSWLGSSPPALPGSCLEAGSGAPNPGPDCRSRPSHGVPAETAPGPAEWSQDLRWVSGHGGSGAGIPRRAGDHHFNQPGSGRARLPSPRKMQVLVAEYQTDGRGRRGRRWFSPLGHGVCLSISWCFEIAPRDLPALSLVAGVAVVRSLAAAGVAGCN